MYGGAEINLRIEKGQLNRPNNDMVGVPKGIRTPVAGVKGRDYTYTLNYF